MKCEKLVKIKKIKHLNMFDENNYLSEVPKYVCTIGTSDDGLLALVKVEQFEVKTHQRQV